jgi:hypothetical protein
MQLSPEGKKAVIERFFKLHVEPLIKGHGKKPPCFKRYPGKDRPCKCRRHKHGTKHHRRYKRRHHRQHFAEAI